MPRKNGLIDNRTVSRLNDYPGFVYLFHAVGTDRYKIGFSIDPTRRLNAILTDSPFEIVELARAWGTPDDEKLTHRFFKHHRVHREWFRFDEIEPVLGYFSKATEGIDYIFMQKEYVVEWYRKARIRSLVVDESVVWRSTGLQAPF